MFYVRGSDPPLDGIVQHVDREFDPPSFTVLIKVTGREKNTDAQHLRHKGAKVKRRRPWGMDGGRGDGVAGVTVGGRGRAG